MHLTQDSAQGQSAAHNVKAVASEGERPSKIRAPSNGLQDLFHHRKKLTIAAWPTTLYPLIMLEPENLVLAGKHFKIIRSVNHPD